MQINSYMTSQGDTWDMISYKVYGHEEGVYELLKANPEWIEVVIFEACITLNIPPIPLEIEESLPPWKKGISEWLI